MMLMLTRRPRPVVRTVALGIAALALSGCADGSARDAGSAAESGAVQVLTSFYPLQYVVEQVGGDLVEVGSLTPPGAEPHDVELSPRQVRELGDADVVVVLSGFQPAVDEAVAARVPEHLVDAAETSAVTGGLGAAPADRHFWLDPTLLAAVAQDVAAALAEADPDHADDFAARAETFVADMTELDEELATGLAQCERRVIVTAHAAFGFLAERYDLEQVGISGLEPDAEPSPARLREVRDVVEEHGVTTIFTETLLNPAVAETLAEDLGVTTAVLDPVESLTDGADDYRGVMEQNLAVLREALGCA